MKSVRIAVLKSRLSEFLRLVRNGQTVEVLDRDTPVARIVPLAKEAPRLVIRKPLRPSRLHLFKPPPPLPGGERALEILLADRNSGR